MCLFTKLVFIFTCYPFIRSFALLSFHRTFSLAIIHRIRSQTLRCSTIVVVTARLSRHPSKNVSASVVTLCFDFCLVDDVLFDILLETLADGVGRELFASNQNFSLLQSTDDRVVIRVDEVSH